MTQLISTVPPVTAVNPLGTEATCPDWPTLGQYQWSPARLIEAALRQQEGILSETGALVVTTAPYTGRAPDCRWLVQDNVTQKTVDWGAINRPVSPEVFDHIWHKAEKALAEQSPYVVDAWCGADPTHRLSVRVVCQRASHALFARQMLLKPDPTEALPWAHPAVTVLSVPTLPLDPAIDGLPTQAAILLDLMGQRIVVAGTLYAGEIKKALFTLMNYRLPEAGVLPMHCSANQGSNGETALFFGLSGTGKTTLSADPHRQLIGDDEHGWSHDGIFNFEGGCYAKAIDLTLAREPEIYEAIRFGALCENVVLNPDTRQPNYADATLTENTRVAYPLTHIPNQVASGRGAVPKVVIFLTADAFGVLPPVARLTSRQAQYYFISGYTSKLAGTEQGVTEPKAAFSSCFGAPFMPRPATVYAALLQQHLEQQETQVYLINTGWVGGPYGVGQRMSLPETRAMVEAALNGELRHVAYQRDPVFGFEVPTHCPGVASDRLDARQQWADPQAYDQARLALAQRFVENFKQVSPDHQALASEGPRF